MRTSFRLRQDKAALLVIDMQRYFCDRQSDANVPKSNILIEKIKNLVDVFSKNERPVVFTRHIDVEESIMCRWWRENISEDDPLSELTDNLDATRGIVLVKHQYDAFFQTDLEKILKDKGITQVVVCGVLTNLCCETTARSAFMKGFEVYFTTDGTATYKKEMHDATQLNLAYGFATMMTVDGVIKAFSE